jgi:membrane-associated phospholipid phosphatase
LHGFSNAVNHLPPQNILSNGSLPAVDHQVATWFHQRLNQPFASILEAMSEPGSAEWIGAVLLFAVGFLVWKRRWHGLVTLVLTVPCGMLFNELIKVLVHRQRPFLAGPFVDWSGYSFASGHTIGATLLYGQLVVYALPRLKALHWRVLTVLAAVLLVLTVGFSRIALGAHYLTDVLAAMVIGTLWITLCSNTAETIRKRRSQRPEPGDNSSDAMIIVPDLGPEAREPQTLAA